MKMNKVAAGALALALGLGAVAPAVASETKSNYTGAQLFLERYEKELKKVNALRDKALVAEAKIAEAKKRLDDAKARLEAAKKAYMALYPSHVFVLRDSAKNKESKDLKAEDFYTPGELVRSGLQEATDELNRLYGDGKWTNDVDKQFAADKATYQSVLDNNLKYARGMNPVKNENTDVLEAAVRRYVNEGYDLYKSAKADSTRILAYQELVAAQGERDAAETNYRAVYDKYNQDRVDYNDALTKLTNDARGYGYVVQIGNNGLKLVKDGEGKIQAPGKTDIARLKEVKEQAQKTLDAAKLIIKNWPETVKNVRSELDALIAKQEKNIAEAEKRIAAAKKVSLVSTAYAEEMEDKSDDALIEDMLSTDKEINDKLDANEKEAKEENEKKPEDKKPEDKKPEDKKPEANKPAKQAGNNVKTGVAGIAGVAGILAAASVAYAASKRD